ncbi:MAG: alkaline phosphatase family protein [Chloroflexi bacterium]|nr:alkaline phosphatase family protein [Chloroflexota bacterium]
MRTRQNRFLIGLVLLLLACKVPEFAAPPPAPPATTFPFTATFPPTATATGAPTFVPTITPAPLPFARRVLILSMDGLRPDAIALAPMPNLQALMAGSAYTLAAQTIHPSATLPAHSSMLTGICPSKHGVNWNDYLPLLGYARGTDLFDLAHAAGMQTVMYVGKEKLRQITEPASTDQFVFINDRDLVIAGELIANFPQDFRLLFVHFPTPDWMGHEYGWLSSQQLSVIFRADEALGNILAELSARGLREETLIIVTADHGGHGTTHGSSLPEDMTIPWIAAGAGIQPRQLTIPVHTMDTAATAAFALGLPIPAEWDGVPVYEAFGLPVERQSAACE